MKSIIVISGKQGSGKTTQSRLLSYIAIGQDRVPRVFKFAEPLYELHQACLPILKRHGIRPEEMKKDGELLQILGTEYGRNKISQSVWIDVCRRHVKAWLELSPHHFAMIDDCRFENEFDAFPDALHVNLQAPTALRKERCSYWREDQTHPSEIGLDEYVRRGKFATQWAGILDTEFVRPEVTAKTIWDRLEKGF